MNNVCINNNIDIGYLGDLPTKGQAYQLLAYLSNQFNNIRILDLGSRYGHSALALSYNLGNRIDSFDTHGEYTEYCENNIRRSNIRFYNENLLKDGKLVRLLSYPLIYIDIDPHNGEREKTIYNYLVTNAYKGVTVWDDIKDWADLREWWKTVSQPKFNVTKWGHFSGTGIIPFGYEVYFG